MSDIFPDLSSTLFKYGPVSNVERTLNDGTVGFSPLNSFNDIYESEYRLVHYFNSLEDQKKLLYIPDSAVVKVRKLVDEQLSKFRVSCFSRRANISLMWSHYADHHKGVCYCFKGSQPEKVFSGGKIRWGNVVYSSALPTVTVYQKYTRKNMLDGISSDVVLTKPMEWSYEEEVRYWTADPNPSVSFDPSSLRAVIAGRRTTDDEIDQIQSTINKFNRNKGQSVQMWFAHRQVSRFTLGICNDRNYRDNSEEIISDHVPLLSSSDKTALTS